MPPRFFHEQLARDLAPELTSDWSEAHARVTLHESEAHHLTRVLRLGAGDRVELFDGAGTCAQGIVRAAENRGRQVHIDIDRVRHIPPPNVEVTVAAAVPKSTLAPDMVRTLTQVGCDRLIPLVSERSVTKPRPGKIDRLDRAVIEACKQCGRAWRMSLDAPTSFRDVVAHEADIRLLAAPEAEHGDPLDRIPHDSIRRILVLIGPEGGWTAEELALARDAGCRPWRLGPHIMRIETAAAAATAIIRHLVGG